MEKQKVDPPQRMPHHQQQQDHHHHSEHQRRGRREDIDFSSVASESEMTSESSNRMMAVQGTQKRTPKDSQIAVTIRSGGPDNMEEATFTAAVPSATKVIKNVISQLSAKFPAESVVTVTAQSAAGTSSSSSSSSAASSGKRDHATVMPDVNDSYRINQMSRGKHGEGDDVASFTDESGALGVPLSPTAPDTGVRYKTAAEALAGAAGVGVGVGAGAGATAGRVASPGMQGYIHGRGGGQPYHSDLLSDGSGTWVTYHGQGGAFGGQDGMGPPSGMGRDVLGQGHRGLGPGGMGHGGGGPGGMGHGGMGHGGMGHGGIGSGGMGVGTDGAFAATGMRPTSEGRATTGPADSGRRYHASPFADQDGSRLTPVSSRSRWGVNDTSGGGPPEERSMIVDGRLGQAIDSRHAGASAVAAHIGTSPGVESRVGGAGEMRETGGRRTPAWTGSSPSLDGTTSAYRATVGDSTTYTTVGRTGVPEGMAHGSSRAGYGGGGVEYAQAMAEATRALPVNKLPHNYGEQQRSRVAQHDRRRSSSYSAGRPSEQQRYRKQFMSPQPSPVGITSTAVAFPSSRQHVGYDDYSASPLPDSSPRRSGRSPRAGDPVSGALGPPVPASSLRWCVLEKAGDEQRPASQLRYILKPNKRSVRLPDGTRIPIEPDMVSTVVYDQYDRPMYTVNADGSTVPGGLEKPLGYRAPSGTHVPVTVVDDDYQHSSSRRRAHQIATVDSAAVTSVGSSECYPVELIIRNTPYDTKHGGGAMTRRRLGETDVAGRFADAPGGGTGQQYPGEQLGGGSTTRREHRHGSGSKRRSQADDVVRRVYPQAGIGTTTTTTTTTSLPAGGYSGTFGSGVTDGVLPTGERHSGGAAVTYAPGGGAGSKYDIGKGAAGGYVGESGGADGAGGRYSGGAAGGYGGEGGASGGAVSGGYGVAGTGSASTTVRPGEQVVLPSASGTNWRLTEDSTQGHMARPETGSTKASGEMLSPEEMANVRRNSKGQWETIKTVEVPVPEEKVRTVVKKETRYIDKEYPVYEVEYQDEIVSVPEIEYVDKYEEVEKVVEVLKHVPVKRVVEVEKEEIEYVPKVEVRYVEKIVEVPKIVEVERPVYVEQPVPVPMYTDTDVPTVVAQKLQPVILAEDPPLAGSEVLKMGHFAHEGPPMNDDFSNVMYVDCEVVDPEFRIVDVFVPKIISNPLLPTHRELPEGKQRVNVPDAQWNSLVLSINPHLEKQIEALPLRKDNGGNISFLPPDVQAKFIALDPAMTQMHPGGPPAGPPGWQPQMPQQYPPPQLTIPPPAPMQTYRNTMQENSYRPQTPYNYASSTVPNIALPPSSGYTHMHPMSDPHHGMRPSQTARSSMPMTRSGHRGQQLSTGLSQAPSRPLSARPATGTHRSTKHSSRRTSKAKTPSPRSREFDTIGRGSNPLASPRPKTHRSRRGVAAH